MDVKTTFLNGFVKVEVYVEETVGFETPDMKNHVFKLKNYLCGLK